MSSTSRCFCCLAIIVALEVFFAVIIVIIPVGNFEKFKLPRAASNVDGFGKDKIGSRPFVFLTQTEQCLRQKLVETLRLHSAAKCKCDVIVLSYKKECKQENLASHITYIFDNSTTWGTGRNKLYFEAIKRKSGYIYYIFTDDDVELSFNSVASPEMKQRTPIQVFQNWLLDYEPAVGVADYGLTGDGRRRVRSKLRNICGILNSSSLANPVIKFDNLFNAFHANAVRHIFPLDTRHENVTWWKTGRYVTSVVELKFRGQALLFFPVTIKNPLHRSYPRSVHGVVQAWQEYIENVRRDAPPQYADNSLFEEYRKDPFLYVETSRTYCREVIPHQPIIPFAHFEHGK